jgi:hypothetical protein
MAADTEGQWEPAQVFLIDPTLLRDPYAPNDASRMVHDSRGLFVVHAILLHTGKILCFCGHVEAMFYAPVVYLYDPTVPTTAKLKAVPMPKGTDLFCCHYVQLYDGRILIIGGSQQDTPNPSQRVYHGSNGATTITVFDPVSETFVSGPPGLQLTQGRWYPTVVLLADGRALAISGRREAGVTPNIADTVEAISPRADACVTLSGGPLALPIYPGIHLSPDGRLYTTHTTWGQEIAEPLGQRLEVTATQATWTPLPLPASQPAHPQREEGMSVPLPVTLPYPQKKGGRYLVVSGGQARGVSRAAPHGAGAMAALGGVANAVFTAQGGGADTRSVEILDATVDPPTWTVAPGTPLALPRVNGHCVLLPDATVLVLGGHDAYKWQAKANVPGGGDPVTTPSLPVEIYSPGSGFTTGASMKSPRMYHAAALLLPDGRVWIAGGADPNENEPPVTYPTGWRGRMFSGGPPGPHLNGQPGTALNRKDYEIYRPPYLCKGLPQPEITGIGPSMQVQYGATFTITTPQAATIAKVAIMRPGAVTHHTDTEQRYIELAKAPPSGTTLTVTMLPATDASLVTPGYYMVWIIDNAGIPCKQAWFIQVSYPPPWPPRAAAPKKKGLCIVATVTMGSPEAPLVRHLQELRARIAADGPAGRVFIAAVNGGYYSFSPRLAARLQRSPHLSRAVREVLVIPGAGCIRAAERLSGRVAHPGRRSALLITLLVGEGLVTAAASPLIVLAAAVHAASGRLRSRASRLREKRRAGGDDG